MVGVAAAILPGAGAAKGDAVDEFEMAGIEAERELNFFAGGGGPFGAVAEMVFHIAAAWGGFPAGIGEFAENLARAFADDIGEDVQAAAMGHPHDDFADALFAGFFEREVEQRE